MSLILIGLLCATFQDARCDVFVLKLNRTDVFTSVTDDSLPHNLYDSKRNTVEPRSHSAMNDFLT